MYEREARVSCENLCTRLEEHLAPLSLSVPPSSHSLCFCMFATLGLRGPHFKVPHNPHKDVPDYEAAA